MPKGFGIMPANPRSERSLRSYAAHLALVMRGPAGGPWVLFKRYGDKSALAAPSASPSMWTRNSTLGRSHVSGGRPERLRAASAALFIDSR